MNPKKEAILRVVLDYLIGNHHEKLTIANIAKVLDIGKSTVYEYFTEKNTMIAEAIFLMIEENVAYLCEIENFDELSFETAFKTHMQRSYDIAKNNRMMENMLYNIDFVSISVSHKAAIQNKIMAAYIDIQQHVRKIFDKGIAERLFDASTKKIREITIESMLLGSVFTITHPDRNIDEALFIEDLYQSVLVLLK